VLFAVLASRDPVTAHMFSGIVQGGPKALAVLPESQRVAVIGQIGEAFRWAFFTIGCFTTAAMLFAWWLPVRRI
jgi:hypothetical protein